MDANDHPSPGSRRKWTRERAYVAQLVFGAGCHSPSIGPRTSEMIASLGLTSEMTALELGSGLGSGSLTIAQASGAWIDGIEPDKSLAQEARKFNEGTKFKDKIGISESLQDNSDIQRHRRDAVLCRESLHRFGDPKQIMTSVCELMKPTGQLILTDFVLVDGVEEEQLQSWIDISPEPMQLWTLDQLRELLDGCGFEVHSARDETEEYTGTILQALHAFATGLGDQPLPVHWREWVMVEVEYWARLVAMFENKLLQLQRISASVKAKS